MRDTWQCYSGIAAITPSDTVYLSPPAMAFFVGAAGNIKIDTPRTVGFTLAVVANTIYPIQVTRVYATGTTATGVTALY